MIKNEETYCTVQHKIVRELGAWEAVVYATIASLLHKTDGIGEVSNQTLIDLCGVNKKSLSRYIATLIEAGYIEKREGVGRGNISIYYITKKGDKMTPFNNEKRGQNVPEKGTKKTIKGDKMTPLNKGINKEINKEYLSSFEVQSPSNDEREEEILIEENKHKSEITPEDENEAVEAVKSLFAADEEKIAPETKSSFAEFWKLFAPDEKQQCKYKVALKYWNDEIPENWRAAAIELLRRGARPNQDNPYFFLQHFSPVKYFLDEREQYTAYKQGVQLCSVRWNRDQRVMSALFAEVFRMEIIDNHYEKRFEI
ncbi:helix-turn-helix domain-containing protein [Methanocorpusculum sp.]|nr:helix-turn-helix domain-containing protein [Methanocorpusculum sp.]